MLNTDPNRPIDEILAEIRTGAIQGVNQRNLGVTLVLPPLSALLVRLSRDAAETADKNLRIQKRLIYLTVLVLGVSVATLILGFFQYRESIQAYPEAKQSNSHGIANPDQPPPTKSK